MPTKEQRLKGPIRDMSPCNGCAEKFEACHGNCQEKLDANIREIFGNDALPFAERYHRFKTVSYKKPKKGWV